MVFAGSTRLIAVGRHDKHRYNCARVQELPLACPFFMPTHKSEQGSWLHPSRLPLGAGWEGHCTAAEHFGERPPDEVLQNGCNLGYAAGCSWLPVDRSCDSVRFAVKRECENRIFLTFACETDHRPKDYGELEFDRSQRQWPLAHPDSRIQRQADCFLNSHLDKASQSSKEPGGLDE